MGKGDTLASGGKSATFGPAKVSQKKWDKIWGDDNLPPSENNLPDPENEVKSRPGKKPVEMYDPPGGWRYGFPKPYKPKKGETLAQTLRRDGYPQRELDNGGAEHVRFWTEAR